MIFAAQKHGNVSFFVPHKGCPCACSFCDQRAISGACADVTPQQAADTAERGLTYRKPDTSLEFAFFGGSFTAIDRTLMQSLLDAVQPYIGPGGYTGIRISTRPDAIDEEVLDILEDARVTAIELGAQSMNDSVLKANRRGHTAQDVVNAAHLIRAHGFSLGLQMMTGLYQSDPDKDTATAKALLALQPDTVRIYPTLVMRGTLLAQLFEAGVYRPQTLDEAVGLCTNLLDLFENAGVRVIRVGLHDTRSLSDGLVAGPYHPAFRELCDNKRYYDKIRSRLKAPCRATVYVAPQDLSKAAGQRRCNIERLAQAGVHIIMKPDPGLAPGEYSIEKEGNV